MTNDNGNEFGVSRRLTLLQEFCTFEDEKRDFYVVFFMHLTLTRNGGEYVFTRTVGERVELTRARERENTWTLDLQKWKGEYLSIGRGSRVCVGL